MKKILIVEDEVIVAMDLAAKLTAFGYRVVGTARSVESGFKQAESEPPDLVLMDVNLKGKLDGVEGAGRIRERFGIPVIYLTACGDEKTLARAKVTEPFGYILKPYDERELYGHIEIALHRHEVERKLRDSEERFSLASQGSNDGLWDWNLATDLVYYSPRWESMLGFPEGELRKIPGEWFNRLHPQDRERVKQEKDRHLAGETPHFETEYRIQHQDGRYRWMLCRGLAIRDSDGQAYRMAGSQTDISDRKIYDPLTGLPNRTLLLERLKNRLDRLRRDTTDCCAVLSVYLDDFSTVSDSLGQAVDELLIQAAQRFQTCLPQTVTIARLGDDHFAILLESIADKASVHSIASLIQRELAPAFYLQGQRIFVSASIGIALSDWGYVDPENWLRDSQTAVCRARAKGKGRIEIFEEEMRSRATARLRLETGLRRAVDQEELELHFQPIVSLHNWDLSGFEALLRWRSGNRLMQPAEFIPVAEETGLIVPMERWVLQKACRLIPAWSEKRGSELTLSINLSSRQLLEKDLLKEIDRILTSSGCEPSRLRIEITETALLDDNETVHRNLAGIQDLNIPLHLDDFGTGYSSLSYLSRFPIGALKIDRSFVQNILESQQSSRIIQAIVGLGHKLDMPVTAEGIETPLQLLKLRGYSCDYGQGYLFSRPVDQVQAEAMLTTRFANGQANVSLFERDTEASLNGLSH